MAEGTQKRVYVDWDKIVLIIRQINKTDLSEYRDSEISYLSDKTGRPWSTIKRVKAEGTTTLETIGEIATALNVNPVDIISADGFPVPKVMRTNGKQKAATL